MYFMAKVGMQNHFAKIHMKMTSNASTLEDHQFPGILSPSENSHEICHFHLIFLTPYNT